MTRGGVRERHVWCPQGESDPRFHLERVASWATRRWGHPTQYRGSLWHLANRARRSGQKGELAAGRRAVYAMFNNVSMLGDALRFQALLAGE